MANATISDLTVSQAVVGPGDIVRVSFTLRNTTGSSQGYVDASLWSDYSGTAYPVSASVEACGSIASGKTVSCAVDLPCSDVNWMADEEYENPDAVRRRPYFEDSAFQALRSANARSCGLRLRLVGSSFDQSVSLSAILVDRHITPTMTLTEQMHRVSMNGEPRDEGTWVQFGLELSLADATWLSSCHLRVYYAADAAAGTSSSYIDLDSDIGNCLAGAQTLILGTDAQTGGFLTANSWHFLIVFGDSCEAVASSDLDVPNAFANVHLSGCSSGGVAFGTFSSATEGNPLFECVYPARLQGGIVIDWYAPTVESGVTTPGTNSYGGGALRVGRIGTHVFVRGGVEARSGATLTTLPSQYRPVSGNRYHLAACSGARIARLYINSSGLFKIEWVRNMDNGGEYSSSTWVDCNFDYWID